MIVSSTRPRPAKAAAKPLVPDTPMPLTTKLGPLPATPMMDNAAKFSQQLTAWVAVDC